MITALYFRNQATICLQFSRSTLDQHVAEKLAEMAEDFNAKADELDRKGKPVPFDLPAF